MKFHSGTREKNTLIYIARSHLKEPSSIAERRFGATQAVSVLTGSGEVSHSGSQNMPFADTWCLALSLTVRKCIFTILCLLPALENGNTSENIFWYHYSREMETTCSKGEVFFVCMVLNRDYLITNVKNNLQERCYRHE